MSLHWWFFLALNTLTILILTLKKFYKISIEWTGKNYFVASPLIGITASITSTSAYLHISLQSLPDPNTKKNSTAVLSPIPLTSAYKESSTLLTSSQKALVQQIIGCLLYYARAIDSSLLVAFNIAAQL